MDEEDDSATGSGPTPRKANTMPSLDDAANKARDFLSSRSRFVAAPVSAVVWGLLAGESKSLAISRNLKTALIVGGTLSLAALLLDYCQWKTTTDSCIY
jgi:hypothetical protein